MRATLSKHRIEALCDGVFAIVMTLLVLDVRVPEMAGPASNERVLATLRSVGPSLAVFALTFALASSFWFFHHLTMQPIRAMSRTMLWMNLICLLFVSMLPFSASLLVRNVSTQAAQMVYYGNMLAISLTVAVHWVTAKRMKLVSEDTDPAVLKRVNQRVWIMPGAAVGALVGVRIASRYAGIGFVAGIVIVRLAGRLLQRNDK